MRSLGAMLRGYFRLQENDEELERPILVEESSAPAIDSVNDENQSPSTSQGLGRWTTVDKEDFFNYCRRFAFASVWVALLVLNYCIGRLFAAWDLPSDAEKNLDAYDVYYSVNNLLLYGLVLAWFAAITEENRAMWIFHWKRWYFFVLFFVVGPIYSWISTADSLAHSFEDIGDWSGAMWTVVILAAIAVGIVVLWHVHFAWKHHSLYGFLVFIFSRIIIISYYWIFALLMQDTHHRDVHLHHYFTGWMAALVAEFNHPVSDVFLGVMSSIFVQGISAYGFDALFNDEKCVSITTDVNMTCHYIANEKFKIHMCPGKHDDVDISCYKDLRDYPSRLQS